MSRRCQFLDAPFYFSGTPWNRPRVRMDVPYQIDSIWAYRHVTLFTPSLHLPYVFVCARVPFQYYFVFDFCFCATSSLFTVSATRLSSMWILVSLALGLCMFCFCPRLHTVYNCCSRPGVFLALLVLLAKSQAFDNRCRG